MENELEERSSLESILEYARIILRWAWLIVLVALVAGFISYFLANQQPRVYQSKTLVMVSGGSSSAVDSYTTSYLGIQLASTYVRTMLTQPTIDAVSNELGFKVNAEQISVSQLENSQLINITVTDQDPNRAALIANTLVAVFADQIEKEQTFRYTELLQGLENELAATDAQIQDITLRLADLEVALSSEFVEPDPQDLATQSQLEANLSQLRSSRSNLYSSYQSIKLAEAQSTSTIIVKDPAVPNLSPIQPQPMRSAMLAAVVGAMLVAGLVFLVTLLQDQIRDPDEFPHRWGIPVLGQIAKFNTNHTNIITQSQPRSPNAEAFRALRTNLRFSNIDTPIKTLLITSPSPTDGKSTIAANLAMVFAQNEQDVILIDCDLHRPTLHKIFKLSNRIGLSDYFIRSTEELSGLVKKLSVDRLRLITSGNLPPNPSELLGSRKMSEMLSLLEKKVDLLIIDTPPILVVTDAMVLAPRMDGVLLVIDTKITKRSAVKQTIEQLHQVNAHIIGVVINNAKSKRKQYYRSRNYYTKPRENIAPETASPIEKTQAAAPTAQGTAAQPAENTE
jgi:capsular exopolysaccharide synthesis family protein